MILELLSLFFIFFKIGLFTFGGGMAMLPLIQQELVTRGLMTAAQSVDMVAISEMTPGPFAINSATFVGMQLYGVPGAVMATLGVILPSVILCLIVARIFQRFRNSLIMRSVLSGIRPVVLALIATSLISVASNALFPNGFTGYFDWPVLLLAVFVFVLLQTGKIHPIFLIAVSGVVGAFCLRT